jgi:endoglucanase
MNMSARAKVIVGCVVLGGLAWALAACSMIAGESAQAPAASPFSLRVNCGARGDYTDDAGNTWLADRQLATGADWGAQGGETVSRSGLAIAGTDAPMVYTTERWGMSGYVFTVPVGSYTVRLHFAETYEGITGEGQRVFSVALNGGKVLERLDPYQAAGGRNKAVVKTFEEVAASKGKMNITFESGVQNPQINGIEILHD